MFDARLVTGASWRFFLKKLAGASTPLSAEAWTYSELPAPELKLLSINTTILSIDNIGSRT
jgi:hypothetical protein